METLNICPMAKRRYEEVPIDQVKVINSRNREKEQFTMNVESIESVGLMKPIRVNDKFIESTGFFNDSEKAKAHISAGAKKVVLSAPGKGEVTTVVLGVNEDTVETAEDIISNASCTTNCITPVAAVIESNFGIEKAMMTTIHSYTASQVLQDGPAAKDKREMRNAAECAKLGGSWCGGWRNGSTIHGRPAKRAGRPGAAGLVRLI